MSLFYLSVPHQPPFSWIETQAIKIEKVCASLFLVWSLTFDIGVNKVLPFESGLNMSRFCPFLLTFLIIFSSTSSSSVFKFTLLTCFTQFLFHLFQLIVDSLHVPASVSASTLFIQILMPSLFLSSAKLKLLDLFSSSSFRSGLFYGIQFWRFHSGFFLLTLLVFGSFSVPNYPIVCLLSISLSAFRIWPKKSYFFPLVLSFSGLSILQLHK